MSHLHQTFLMITDLETSREFYEDKLGLEPVHVGDGSAEYETGECALLIEEDFDADTLAAFGLEPPGDDRGDGVIIVLEVDDVQAVYEQAESRDATILLTPTEVDWGREMFLVQDPDGYILEVSRPLT